jgi:hypothetical protein
MLLYPPTSLQHDLTLRMGFHTAFRLLQQHGLVHPSLSAAIAWRYGQLLTALPNRGSEAAAWGNAAHQLWHQTGWPHSKDDKSSGSCEVVLGELTALTGKGHHGCGALVSLFWRRLYPPNGHA